MQMGLQVLQIKVQTGLRLIDWENLVGQKTRSRHQVTGKKADRQNRKSQDTGAPVVTLKHIAAEIAEAHELPKTPAETMLTDTVDRVARHLVKGSKVRIVGLGIFQVKRREARMGRNPQTGEALKIKASKKVIFLQPRRRAANANLKTTMIYVTHDQVEG
jgi:DNA-binding protein HU-beta